MLPISSLAGEGRRHRRARRFGRQKKCPGRTGANQPGRKTTMAGRGGLQSPPAGAAQCIHCIGSGPRAPFAADWRRSRSDERIGPPPGVSKVPA